MTKFLIAYLLGRLRQYYPSLSIGEILVAALEELLYQHLPQKYNVDFGEEQSRVAKRMKWEE